jgi:23S rRNA (cytosine1962-C5)-methyltransferase
MITPIRLKKDAERRINAGHLWIFSNDIDTQTHSLKNYTPGDLVRIETAFGKPIALGYINPHCLLCIRILTLNTKETINTEFFIRHFQQAQSKRTILFSEPFYRVVFGESDRLPGLVIDQYDRTLVMQINTAGMEKLKPILITAAQSAFNPDSLVLKCDSSERAIEGLENYFEVIGNPLPNTTTVKENGCEYHIALQDAQKTGWFYDHRTSRAQIAKYCENKRVLDVFSYCGAFAIPCAKSGATEVMAIDRSANALKSLTENATINSVDIQTRCGDALELLQQLEKANEKFDVIILDPPALIKRKKDIPAGEKMYQKLNEAALRLLNPNGILLSASCSMHLSAENLQNCIRRAGLSTGKTLSIIAHCHQGPDHPIHPAIPETNYLKGFIVST